MSRPFPLGGLLRVRERAEERAAAELAAARREAEAVRLRQQSAREALADSALPEGADRLAWIAAVASRSSLALLLQEAEHDVHVAEQYVSEQAQHWSSARRDVRAIDRLAQRHDEAERALEAHTEQVVLDEVASRRAAAETVRTPGGGA
ncbi:MAG: flagellar export protein FliJ [Cellulomonas sp.]|uniref:flagellar export protein FliJ n=1 Tax=Cellulomonas sp. TaxID=40001 RepID=UPI00258E66A9|nr:flagellar FliJ family protein [Cellulomonas sp.]MCR6649607.1 flagellar export protein FliJ [Cellulomonas sp.]MCR6705578.1 flagellar export protein FliJ [Cellulomonas sp.]